MTVAEFIPPTEAERIAAVRRYDILDTPPDGAFDRIAAAAADLFGVPIGIVSIVDTDRIWFKSHHGLPDVSEIARDPGLCASAILGDDPWVVTDAATDPRTLANPLVAGDLGLRFYAGAPLRTTDGHNLGTLCVLDSQPREVSPAEARILAHLASLVVDQLELRLSARTALTVAEAHLQETEQLASALQRSLLPPALPDIANTDLAAAYLPASRYHVGGDFYDVFPIDEQTWALVIGDVCGKGPEAAGRTSCARYTLRAAAVREPSPAAALSLVNQALLLDAAPELEAFVTALFARFTPHPHGASITLAAAGHPLPTVLRADGTVAQVGTPGGLLGIFPDVLAVDASLELGPGDTLVLITDGVTDSGAPRLEQEGLEALLVTCRGLSPALIAARIHSTVAATQADDVPLLILTVGR